MKLSSCLMRDAIAAKNWRLAFELLCREFNLQRSMPEESAVNIYNSHCIQINYYNGGAHYFWSEDAGFTASAVPDILFGLTICYRGDAGPIWYG
jgi:hypothetical protein